MQEPEIADDSASLPRRRTRRSSGAWPHVPPAMIQSPQIDVETLQEHFHLPITEVAKKLGVCATVLKKICRKNGISRWPHRKIKSLDKTIAQLEATKSKNPQQQAKINEELVAARHAKEQLIRNPNGGAPQRSIKSRRVHRPSFRGLDAASDDSSFDSSDGMEPHSSSSTSEAYHGGLRRHTGRSSSRSSIDDLPSLRSMHIQTATSSHHISARASRASSISIATNPQRASTPSSARSLSVSSGAQVSSSPASSQPTMTKGQRGLQTLLTATLEGPSPVSSGTPQPPPLQVPLTMSTFSNPPNHAALVAGASPGPQFSPYMGFPSFPWPPPQNAQSTDGKPTFNPPMMLPLNYMSYMNYMGFPGYPQASPGTPGSFVDQSGVTRLPCFLPPGAPMNPTMLKPSQIPQQTSSTTASFLPPHLAAQAQQLQQYQAFLQQQQQAHQQLSENGTHSPTKQMAAGVKGAPSGAGESHPSGESCVDLMNLAMTASDGIPKDAMAVDQPTNDAKQPEQADPSALAHSPVSSPSTATTSPSNAVDQSSGSLRASTASVPDEGALQTQNNNGNGTSKFPLFFRGGEISIAPLPSDYAGNVSVHPKTEP